VEIAKTGPRIVVRKSVFIGSVIPVSDEKTARELAKEIKRGKRKAAHIAFAFRIAGNPVKEGMSDNGEPRGTAGLPILMLLRYRQITDIMITVTRYWGGTKLGPGNLKRAYRDAALKALETV
jgi:putative IMPACT (imprinted ancient) family translation regulator